MAALAVLTGEEFIAAVNVGGGGSQFGQWDAVAIDANDATLIPIPTSEFNYCSEVLTAAGYTPASLSATDFALANRALIYGMAYQLLQASEMANTPINGENGNGVMQPWYNSRNAQWFTMADQAYQALGITSKYYVDMTAGFAVSSIQRANLRGSLDNPYTC